MCEIGHMLLGKRILTRIRDRFIHKYKICLKKQDLNSCIRSLRKIESQNIFHNSMLEALRENVFDLVITQSMFSRHPPAITEQMTCFLFFLLLECEQ